MEPSPTAASAPAETSRASTGLGPWIAFAIFAAYTGYLSFARFASFHSRSLDMAYYIRLVWGLAHGLYDNPIVGAHSWLGLHCEPILLPLAALARVGVPIPSLLLAVQALGTAAAIFPAWSLAKRRLGFGAAGLAIFLIPTVSRCVDYDFHPSTISIWPLLALCDSLDRGSWKRAWIWALVALTFREDVGLQVAAVAATFAFTAQSRKHALAMVTVGIAWFAIYAFAVQPLWLPDPTTGSYGAHFARFGGGAGGVGGVIRAAFADPAALARYLVSEDRPIYAVLLLLQVAFLPLAAPRYLAGALPVYLINLLSDFPRVRTVQAHYATTIAPFLVAAAICGAGRLRRLPAGKWLPATLLLAASAIGFWMRGASPGSPEWRVENYKDDAYAVRARQIIADLPADASVAASARVLAHVAERTEVYEPHYRPAGDDTVDEVIEDADDGSGVMPTPR